MGVVLGPVGGGRPARENRSMGTLFHWLLRLLLVVAGLVLAASLLLALLMVLSVWAARSAWARLTGRPVAPFVMHIDPRSGFNRVYRARQSRPEAGAPVPPTTGRTTVLDVTDVKPKQPRS